MNLNCFSEMVQCIILRTLTNCMGVRTMLVLHIKAPLKSSLGHIRCPTDKSSELHILRQDKLQYISGEFMVWDFFSLGNCSSNKKMTQYFNA